MPYDGELEEVRNRAELSERDYSEEERVSFRDAELERMICEARGKPDVEAVYASELETVTRLSMRFGIAAFNEEVINASVGYRQDKPLDLSDLALLPNLRDGDLEKQISTNEVLSACRDAIAVVEPPAGVEGISSTAIREHLFDPDAVAAMLHPAVLTLLRKLKPEDFPEEIIEFKGEYAFLGNDYPARVVCENIVYPCAEAAFQASKSDDPAVRKQFAQYASDKAKQKGNQMTPRPGWEEEKGDIMRGIVHEKFLQNADLLDRLLETGNRRLINGGKGKKDTCWGVNTFTWEGENRLGRILMELREAFGKETFE